MTITASFVVYGEGKGGHTPVEGADTLFSNSVAHVLDLLGEGYIEGLVDNNKSVFYNEVALTSPTGKNNFNGVVVSANHGSADQAAISGFDDVRNTVSVAQTLAYNTYKTVSFPNDGSITAIDITINTNNFFKVADNGDTGGTSVSFDIELSQNGGSFVVVASGTISGKQKDNYDVDYRVAVTNTGGQTAVRVKRTTPDSASQKISDVITFKSATKVNEHKLTYPNCAVVGHTIDAKQFGNQIPTRQYHVKGLRVMVPHNYNAATRQYSGSFTGQLVGPTYTNNPAWVFYDLVTAKRYGLGQFFDSSLIDIPSLYSIAKWCDGYNTRPNGTTDDYHPVTGKHGVPDGKGGYEPRWTCNTVINTRGDAFSVIKEMVTGFRGILFWMESKLWAMADQPQSAVKIVTNANVINGVFTYSGEANRSRSSVVNVSWNDPDIFYRRAIETHEDPDLIRELGWKPVDYGAFGCTSRSQARRLGKAILYSQEYESEIVTYTAGLDHTLADASGTIGIAPGDLILISDDARGNALSGGRIVSYTPGSPGTVVLDDNVSATGSGSLYVEHSDGTVEYVPCTYTSGTPNVSLTSAPGFTIQPNDLFILIAGAAVAETFRVVKIGESAPNTFEVSAMRYNADKFAAIYGDTRYVQGDIMRVASGATIAPPTDLYVAEGYVYGAERNHRTLELKWTAPVDNLLDYYSVAYSKNNDNWVTLPPNGSTSARIDDASAGAYRFRISSVNRLGKPSVTALTGSYTLATVPDPSALPLGTVTNLVLQQGGATFAGRDAAFKWSSTNPTATYLYNAGGIIADTGIMDPAFRDFYVVVKKTDGTVLRSESVVNNTYTYTYEKNFVDTGGSPVRSFIVEVSYRDIYNRTPTPATITVTNPAPFFPSSPTVLTAVGGVSVTQPIPTDPDYVGMKVYASLTSGFTPGAGNLVYAGPDNYVVIPKIGSGVHYVVTLPYDAFGDGTGYTGQQSATPADVVADIAALSSDSVLSHGSEKQKAVIDFNAIYNDYTALEGKYSGLGSPPELVSVRNNAAAAIANGSTSLSTYLNNLSPSWSDTSVDTPIVAADWSSQWSNALTTLSAYRAALASYDTSHVGLTAIGSYSFVKANSVAKYAGTHGAYQGGAVAPPQTNSAFISSSIVAATVGGGWYTSLSLDDDATTFDGGSNQKYMAQITVGTAGTGTLNILNNGAVLAGPYTVPNLTTASRMALVYDGTSIAAYVNGIQYGSVAVAAGQTLWPKVIDYHNTGDNGYRIIDVAFGPAYMLPKAGATLVSSSGATLGDSAIMNTSVTVKPDGSLNNAGGGAPTLGGLQGSFGTTIDNAAITIGTDGKMSTGVTTLTPIVDNSKISLSAGGVLAGGSGGSVTIPGLETSGGLYIQNSRIVISSGAITGIGSGAGTIVDNGAITIGADGKMSTGVTTLTPIVDNSKLVISSDGILTNSGTVQGAVTASGVGASYITLYEPAATKVHTIVGNKVVRTGTNDASWQGNVYSQETQSGSGMVSGRIVGYGMMGLATTINTSQTNAYGYIDWCVFRASSTQWVVRVGGAEVLNMGAAYNGVTFGDSTIWTVVYYGPWVQFFADGVMMYQVTTGAGQTVRAAVTAAYSNTIFSGLTFGAAGIVPKAGSTLVDSSGIVLGDVQIKNSSITMNANGSISGAGGGSVTIGGLGYLGDLNATYGASAANFTGTVGGGNRVKNSNMLGTTWAGGASGFGVYDNDNNATGITLVAGPDGNSLAAQVTFPSNATTKGIYLGNLGGIDNTNTFVPNTTQMVSWYAKASGGAVGLGMGMAFNFSPSGGFTMPVNPALTTGWQRYVAKCVWGSVVDSQGFITISGTCGAGTIAITNVQVENGDVVTAYSPNPVARAGSNLFDGSGAVMNDATVKNSAVSINSDGTIIGAGGGAPTLSGLQGRFGTIIDNSVVGIDASGRFVNSVGTGNSTYISNQKMRIVSGKLTYDGGSYQDNINIDNSQITMSPNGQIVGAGGGQVTPNGIGVANNATSGSNLLTDPVMLSRTTYYGAAALQVAPGNGPNPHDKYRVVCTADNSAAYWNGAGGTQGIAVTPGETVYFQHSIDCTPNVPGAQYAYVYWFDVDGNPCTTSASSIQSRNAAGPTNTWVSYACSFTVPPGAAYAQPFSYAYAATTWPTGAAVYFADPYFGRQQPGATVGSTAGSDLKDASGALMYDATVKNTSVSIGVDGGIVGAGGGAPTLAGLQGRFGTVIDNSAVSVNSAGQFVSSVSPGSGSYVANTKMRIVSGKLTYDGANNLDATNIDNSQITMSTNGTINGAGGGGVTIGGLGYSGALDATKGADWSTNVSNIPYGSITKNYFPMEAWYAGSTMNMANIGLSGNASAHTQVNQVVAVTGPGGTSELCLQMIAGTDGAGEGGFDWSGFNAARGFVPTEAYRYSIWVYRNAGATGNIYLGGHSDAGDWINPADGTHNTNPYFFASTIPTGKWYLVVGILQASGSTNPNSGLSGVYDPDTGLLILGTADYRIPVGATYLNMRAYQYYASNNSTSYFARPLIERMTGTSPSIAQMMSATALLNKNQQWGDVNTRPSNLTALTGSEPINNTAVSINSDGTLVGGGGGQVTAPGLGVSAGAGTSGLLYPIGSYTRVTGNTVGKYGGTHGAFQGGAVGTAQVGSAFITSSIINAVGGGGWTTNLSLDDDNTTFTPGTDQLYDFAVNVSPPGTANWSFQTNGTSLKSGTVTGIGANTRMGLYYDGTGVAVAIDGNILAATKAPPGLKLYPKVLDFYNSGDSNVPVTDVQYGAFTNNAAGSDLVLVAMGNAPPTIVANYVQGNDAGNWRGWAVSSRSTSSPCRVEGCITSYNVMMGLTAAQAPASGETSYTSIHVAIYCSSLSSHYYVFVDGGSALDLGASYGGVNFGPDTRWAVWFDGIAYHVSADGVEITGWASPSAAARHWAAVSVANTNVSVTQMTFDIHADVTALSQISVTGPSSVTVAADYQGNTGTLNKTLVYVRKIGVTDVSSTTTWSIPTASGCAVSIDTTGNATLTAITVENGGYFIVRNVRDGISNDFRVAVGQNRSAPPVNTTGTGGNPGTTGNCDVSATASTTTYGGTVSGYFSCVAGTAGQVALSANPDVQAYGTAKASGSNTGYATWQKSTDHSTWSDCSSEFASGTTSYNNLTGATTPSNVNAGVTATGLTSGTTYYFRLAYREANTLNGGTVVFSGVGSGTGS